MDDKSNQYARCEKNTKAYLYFTEKFKVERMQAQEILLGYLQCLESENKEEDLKPKLLDVSLSF
jgi:hypothetical protein